MIHAPMVSIVAGLARLGGPEDLLETLAGRYDESCRSCDCTGCARWDWIVRAYGLSDVERSVLAAAAAVSLDRDVARLVDDLAQDRVRGASMSLELACAVVDAGIDDVRHLAHPASTLMRFELLRHESRGRLGEHHVAVSEQLASSLCGVDLVDPLLARVLVRCVELHHPAAQHLARAMDAGEPLCYVHEGGPGSGRAVGARACTVLGVAPTAVDLSLLERASPVSTLCAALLQAVVTGTVLVVDGAHTVGPAVREVVGLLASAPIPTVLVGRMPWRPEWHRTAPVIVPAPELSLAERQHLWGQTLDASGGTVQPTARPTPAELNLLHHIQLAPTEIAFVSQAASLAARYADPDEELSASMTALARGVVSPTTVVREQIASARLDDLLLAESARTAVEQLIDWARHRDAVFADRAILGKATRGTGLTAMFTGPPGTGKTLTAEVVAGELDLPLLVVNLAEVIDKYIGETESNLERVFEHAERTAGVLFFDEADALFGARSATSDAKDRFANQEIAYLLQRMETFNGVAILASNLPGNLDAAFMRRLHFVVHFTLPDATTRRQLWEAHLDAVRSFDPADPVDLDALSDQTEIAGGDIRNIVLAATFAAASEARAERGCGVGQRHIVAAHRREMLKLRRRA